MAALALSTFRIGLSTARGFPRSVRSTSRPSLTVFTSRENRWFASRNPICIYFFHNVVMSLHYIRRDTSVNEYHRLTDDRMSLQVGIAGRAALKMGIRGFFERR